MMLHPYEREQLREILERKRRRDEIRRQIYAILVLFFIAGLSLGLLYLSGGMK